MTEMIERVARAICHSDNHSEIQVFYDLAREDKDLGEAVRYWMNAEAQWDEYIAQSGIDGKDPWIAIARPGGS